MATHAINRYLSIDSLMVLKRRYRNANLFHRGSGQYDELKRPAKSDFLQFRREPYCHELRFP